MQKGLLEDARVDYDLVEALLAHLLGGAGGGKIPRGSGILVFLPGMGDILNLTEVCFFQLAWRVDKQKLIAFAHFNSLTFDSLVINYVFVCISVYAPIKNNTRCCLCRCIHRCLCKSNSVHSIRPLRAAISLCCQLT